MHNSQQPGGQKGQPGWVESWSKPRARAKGVCAQICIIKVAVNVSSSITYSHPCAFNESTDCDMITERPVRGSASGRSLGQEVVNDQITDCLAKNAMSVGYR